MEIKKVSSKACLILPKEFAGKLVSVEKIAEGVLQVKTCDFIPDSEQIFHTEKYKKRLDSFDRWMDNHVPEDSDLDKLNYSKAEKK